MDTQTKDVKNPIYGRRLLTDDNDGGGGGDDEPVSVGQRIRFWTPSIRKVSMAGRSCLNDPCGSTKLVTVVVTVI